MSITSYSELKTAVASWLKRSDLTSYIPDLITFGENRIYRDLRVRAMETNISTAISSGVVAVPSGYKEMKYAYIDGAPVQKLQRKDAEWIYQNYPFRSSDGTPKFFARDGQNFIFGPYPTDGFTLKGVYYKRLDPLSDSNTSNWLITDASDLILFAALCEAEPFIKNDQRALVWETKYRMLKDQIQLEDRREDHSGSVLSMTAG